jgi:type II secretory pathway component GspD/PulD (secretin)
MISYISRNIRIIIFLICCLLVLVFSKNVYGTYWTEDNYTHFSRDEPLREVLKAMAENQGSHIIISDKVKGNISAYYRNKSTAEIFDKIKKIYNLVTYDDGDTLYVYPMGEIIKVSIKMKISPVSHLEQELINTGVLNKKNIQEFGWKINEKNNNVRFMAPPRFVEIAKNVAYELEQNEYIYKWKDKANIIHYSNEPPFSGVKYMKIMKIENKDIREVPTRIDTSISLLKKVIDGKAKGVRQ